MALLNLTGSGRVNSTWSVKTGLCMSEKSFYDRKEAKNFISTRLIKILVLYLYDLKNVIAESLKCKSRE